MKLFVICGLFAAFLFAGCSSSNNSATQSTSTQTTTSDTKEQSAKGPSVTYPGDSTQAQPITTDSGLQYIDLVPGTGATPKTGDKVSVHYTGYLMNGRKFDSSVDRGQPLSFKIGLGKVIRGWDEGVMTMKIGGKRKLIIPADLGYGSSGAGDVIPPDAQLIFDVELLGIQ